MGRYLFHKKKHEDKEIWVESVKMLHENSEIIDKLRICYECSNCSCNGFRTPVSSLRNLIDRSLLKLDEDDRLKMHDVLRDMGRDVVKRDRVKGQPQPAKEWTHLWDPVIAEQELSCGEVSVKVS